MAADSNGRLVEPGQKGMNGMNGHANGHATTPRSKPVKKQKGFSLFSTISRYDSYKPTTIMKLIRNQTPDLVLDYHSPSAMSFNSRSSDRRLAENMQTILSSTVYYNTVYHTIL